MGNNLLLGGDSGDNEYHHNNSSSGVQGIVNTPMPLHRFCWPLFPVPFDGVHIALMAPFPPTGHQSSTNSICGATRPCVTAPGRSRSGVKGGGVPAGDSTAWHHHHHPPPPPLNQNKPTVAAAAAAAAAATSLYTKGVSNKHTCVSSTTTTTTTTTTTAAAIATAGVVVMLSPQQPPSPPPPPPPRLLSTTSTRRHLYVLLTALLLVAVQVPRVSCHLARRKPATSREKRELINDETQRYMMKYGYLPASDMETGNLRTEEQLREAIRAMQRFGHIPVTGVLDEATKELMTRPRCSLPDVLPPDAYYYHHPPTLTTSARHKRFVKHGKRWHRYNITWGIRTYPENLREKTGRQEDLTHWEIQREIRLATEVWGRPSLLEFKELEYSADQADIIVDFKKGYHGDGYPFDGVGRTLAHAFYPGEGIGGDVHFDEEEPWVQHKDSDGSWDRVSLFITAAHELGHALGLYHSDVEGALMSPYLIKYPNAFRLPEDDVRGIQELYGINKNWKEEPYPTPTQPPTTPPTKPPVTKKPVLPPKKTDKPDSCDTSYDALSVIRREIYMFKGKYFWRMDTSGNLRRGYPALISQFWSTLPKNTTHVDAVYERTHDHNIVFFIGDKFYVCRGNHELLKVGRLRNLGLPEDLKKIDAAFVWGYNGRTYLFAETMYWRFDETIEHVELDYPRAMDMWHGVPYNIDSAFKFNGTTYFFQGKVFWEFDDFRMKVKKKSPALAAPYWLGCPMTENPYVLETAVTTSECPVLRPPPLLLLLLLLSLVDI